MTSLLPYGMTMELDGGPGNDAIQGGPSEENVYGAEGSDAMRAGAGDNALVSLGTGGDRLFGEAGNDQLVSATPCGGHEFYGGPGGNDIAGFARTTMFASPRRGIRAGLGGFAALIGADDSCRATALGNGLEVLEGTTREDVLFGSDGADTLWGRQGNDDLHGAGEPDVLNGHEGFDRLYAQDGQRDLALNCGGPGQGRIASRDERLDPRGRNCVNN